MNWKVHLIMRYIQKRIRKPFIRHFGTDAYRAFCSMSVKNLNEILPAAPDIGRSVFSLDYYFIICCLNWFDTFKKMGQTPELALLNVSLISEEYLKTWPSSLLKFVGRNIYHGVHLRRAYRAEKMAAAGKLHAFDWRIQFKRLDKNTFQFDIYECGALKLANKLDMLDAFPTICRLDYLLSHYMGVEFKRTGTLADGDGCCDCFFHLPGYTMWPAEVEAADISINK